jgi:hypothetical protein
MIYLDSEKKVTEQFTKDFIEQLSKIGTSSEFKSVLLPIAYEQSDILIRGKVSLKNKKISTWNDIASFTMTQMEANGFIIVCDADDQGKKYIIFIYFLNDVFYCFGSDLETKEVVEMDITEVMPHMVKYDYDNNTDRITYH